MKGRNGTEVAPCVLRRIGMLDKLIALSLLLFLGRHVAALLGMEPMTLAAVAAAGLAAQFFDGRIGSSGSLGVAGMLGGSGFLFWEISKCWRPSGASPLLLPGALDGLFRRVLSDFPQYHPEALSTAPWIISLHSFLSDEEIEALVHGCEAFDRSATASGFGGSQIASLRTSSTCWCRRGGRGTSRGAAGASCGDQTQILRLRERIANVTRAPSSRHLTNFQVLRYESGQYYKPHHDQNSAHWTPHGVRVLSFLVYLSTPTAGGATRFPELRKEEGGLTVPAVKGNALLWTNVVGSEPTTEEVLTRHEALPVREGEKLAANVWIHQFDHTTPSDNRCVLMHYTTR